MSLIKSPAEIETMARAGAMLRKTLDVLKSEIKVGISLLELDKRARELIEQQGGQPAFLGYKPAGATRAYPATICASVNNVVVHGVPSSYKLKAGDVVSIDCGVKLNGYYSDAAFTVIVGESKDAKLKKLVSVTEQSLELGIEAAQAGATVGDIGNAIGSFIKKNGFYVVRGLTGHGIGTHLHEEPSIFNEGRAGTGPKLVPGMVIAIEPMVSIGTNEIIQLADESYGTKDGSISAHFEKTIVITVDGPRVIT
jgi:methionyl aminopeptidase